MKYIIPVLLTFVFLLGIAGESFALPKCEGSPRTFSNYKELSSWSNCEGTVVFFGGKVKYVGQWKKGKEHGQGTIIFSNGNKFVGEFKNHRKNGTGTFTFADGGKYVGVYRDNKLNGQGIYTHPNGYKYVGEYRNDEPHGQGTSTYADGNKYVGEFRNGKRHGHGTFTYADGKILKGMFENGNFIGKGFAHAKSIDSIDSSKFKPGIEYTNFTDSSCKNSKKKICVNNIDYEYLCNKAKSITTFARRKTAVHYRGAFSTFIGSGGNFGSLKINFRAPNYCAVSFVISGLFDGTSTRKLISGRGNTFIVTKSGEILIHHIDT